MRETLKIVGIATIESRKENLKLTIESIINQVDRIYVYQNGYKEIFDFLNDPKISVISSVDTGIDMGDAGKFYMLNKTEECYFFSIDDDLIYPTDYIDNLTQKLKKYDNKVILSHHGRIMRKNAKSYYDDIFKNFRCLDKVTTEEPIDFGGTGVMGFHSKTVKSLDFDYFKNPNMADIWVGKYAKENNIKIIILPHEEGWIKTSLDIDDKNTIFQKYRKGHAVQDKILVETMLNTNRKINLTILTCTWKRPEITKIYIKKLLELEEKTSDKFNFTNIVIDSENSNIDNFINDENFIYKNYSNTPVSNKWNFGSSLLKEIDFDYVLIMGSDDFIDSNLLVEYNKKMKEGYDLIGITDLFIYDTPTDKLFYWGGYDEKSGRKNETTGLGRCLSKSLVEKLNYNLWELGLNKGLDSSMQKKIRELVGVRSVTLTLKNNCGFACDIKGDNNITPLDTFKKSLSLINKELFLDRNLNLNYDIKKLSRIVDRSISKNKNVIYDLSIIISTYKNVEYLKSCFDSIIDSVGDQEVEVLIGIDSCLETREYVMKNDFPDYFRFFFFKKNVGPYIVFNTLSDISLSKNIMFFGSDDLMGEQMVSNMINGLFSTDCIRASYVNFKDGSKIDTNSKKISEGGVFAIKKEVFDSLNGFEPWMCSADTEFMNRYFKNKLKYRISSTVDFYRRIHNKGLTSRPDTGMTSKLRSHYVSLMTTKKNFGPLPDKITEPYTIIKEGSFKIKGVDLKILKSNTNKLGGLLNKPKVDIPQTINYEKVNEVVQKREVQKKPERPKPEPRPADKNSNSAMAQNVRVSKKPIRTNAKPINLNGGKNFLRF